MPDGITSPTTTADEPTPDSHPHEWIGAANVPLDVKSARRADQRGSIRLPQETKVTVLEVSCNACRRPYDDVVDEPCSALVDNTHLRGGPIGERKKRVHHYQEGDGSLDPFAAINAEPFYAARRRVTDGGAITF